MADDRPLKTSFELAMERLRKGDAEAGRDEQPLSERQKSLIAEIRAVYQAKTAEQEILVQSRLRRTPDPGEREALEAQLRIDRERLSLEREGKIDKIRRGEST
jgi:hypothetical protein